MIPHTKSDWLDIGVAAGAGAALLGLGETFDEYILRAFGLLLLGFAFGRLLFWLCNR